MELMSARYDFVILLEDNISVNFSEKLWSEEIGEHVEGGTVDNYSCENNKLTILSI